jgi:hypothetical protein
MNTIKLEVMGNQSFFFNELLRSLTHLDYVNEPLNSLILP